MKLSEPQARVLRAMLELKCWISTYKGLQLTNRGRAWFVWAGQFLKGRRVRLGTVEALERRGLIKARGWPYAYDVRYRNLVLTDKGREVAKELEAQDGETE